jgi:tetratricopeptide (TPR) repeat protein
MDRVDDALEMFRWQIEVTPRDRYATYNLALALGSEGGWEEALPRALMAAEVAPPEIGRWTFLGKTQIKTGHVDEARRSFDRALALPHEPAAENKIAYALGDAGADLDNAWRLISQALEAKQRFVCEPQSLADGDKCTDQLRSLSLMLDTAGWILYRQEKVKDAEPYLRAASGVTPDSANQLHLAVIFARTGRLDLAVRFFAQAHVRSDFARADAPRRFASWRKRRKRVGTRRSRERREGPGGSARRRSGDRSGGSERQNQRLARFPWSGSDSKTNETGACGVATGVAADDPHRQIPKTGRPMGAVGFPCGINAAAPRAPHLGLARSPKITPVAQSISCSAL